jgi:hypothetical protein
LKDADQTFNAAPADVFHRIRYGALQIGMVARLPTARHFNIRPRQRYRSQALPQQLVLALRLFTLDFYRKRLPPLE